MSNRQPEPGAVTMDLEQLESHRTALMRFAILQVRNREVAEDLTQETMLAAIAQKGSFAGRSAVRTWLVGILRHKIINHINRSGREVAVDMEAADELDELFLPNGRHVDMPRDWGTPEAILSEKGFFKALEKCVSGLPVSNGQAFLMREVLGCEADEICKELDISATNLWVILHRARMRLRACLESGWFAGQSHR